MSSVVDYTTIINTLKTILKRPFVYKIIKTESGILINSMLKELEKRNPDLFKTILTKIHLAEKTINDSGDIDVLLKEIEDVDNNGIIRCGVYMIINNVDLFVKIVQNLINIDKLVSILKKLPIGDYLQIIASCFGFKGDKKGIIGWLASQCKNYLDIEITTIFNELRQQIVSELVLTDEQRNNLLTGGSDVNKINIEQIDKNKINTILKQHPEFEVPLLVMRGVFHVLLERFKKQKFTRLYNEKFGVKQQGGNIDLVGFILIMGLIVSLLVIIVKIIKQSELLALQRQQNMLMFVIN